MRDMREARVSDFHLPHFHAHSSHVRSAPETLLAFDVGARRIGVAVGNDLVRQAHAAAIVNAADSDDGFAAIAKLIAEWRPERLVVGVPLPLDTTADTSADATADATADASTRDDRPSPALARCERFIEQLKRRFKLPVARVDERYSSLDADAIHRERRRAGTAKRAKALDDVAAQVILQRYFDALPMSEALA